MTTCSTNIITCVYHNATAGMQIVRIDETPDFTLERVVLPGQCLRFEAPTTASLQIHSYRMRSAIYEDTLPCQQLQQPAAPSVTLVPERTFAVAA